MATENEENSLSENKNSRNDFSWCCSCRTLTQPVSWGHYITYILLGPKSTVIGEDTERVGFDGRSVSVELGFRNPFLSLFSACGSGCGSHLLLLGPVSPMLLAMMTTD